jgi:hypothetical protein
MEPLKHHPQGPSNLEHLDPKSGGCYAFVRDPTSSEGAELGTLEHESWARKDLSLLGGDTELEAEVLEVGDYVRQAALAFDGEEFHEVTLEIPGLNFGTIDFFKVNRTETQGLIVDAKFGAWSVTDARHNLQGLNYAAFLFHRYPRLAWVDVVFYMVKHHQASTFRHYRRNLWRILKKLERIVFNAQRVARHPEPKDFTPNPVNCGFCQRLNCPARLQLTSSLLSTWTKQPVQLPSFDLVRISTSHLAALKRVGNALKTLTKAIDEEARRRAFDEGDIVPGYEIRQKAGRRTVVGVDNINKAQEILIEAWSQKYPEIELPLGPLISENVEVAVGDLEKAASRVAPRGEILRSQALISDALSQAKLVNSAPIFYLAQIKE